MYLPSGLWLAGTIVAPSAVTTNPARVASAALRPLPPCSDLFLPTRGEGKLRGRDAGGSASFTSASTLLSPPCSTPSQDAQVTSDLYRLRLPLDISKDEAPLLPDGNLSNFRLGVVTLTLLRDS